MCSLLQTLKIQLVSVLAAGYKGESDHVHVLGILQEQTRYSHGSTTSELLVTGRRGGSSYPMVLGNLKEGVTLRMASYPTTGSQPSKRINSFLEAEIKGKIKNQKPKHQNPSQQTNTKPPGIFHIGT